MLLYLVPLLYVLSTVTSLNSRAYNHVTYPSVASTSQIKFAIENKYDDTGPASQRPVYAYNTYKSLEEALIAYFDDPDTQLPASDRAKAVQKLLSKYTYTPSSIAPISLKLPPGFKQTPLSLAPKEPYYKQPAEKSQFKPLEILRHLKTYDEEHQLNHAENSVLSAPVRPELFQFEKFPTVKDSSLTLAHYTRDREPHVGHPPQISEFPNYSFSYGVHDPNTGDIKRAGERKTGNTVQGFYRFIGPDGRERLVQYRADDKNGFRAKIDKLPIRH